MRVRGSGYGRRPRLLRRMGRNIRRVATGTGVLALAVPLAWQPGAGGQHLDIPSASSVRSGVIRLADWMTGDASTPPAVPAQQTGTAVGQQRLVSAASTEGLTHVTGHAPGTGNGQLPLWAPRARQAVSGPGTYTSGSPSSAGYNAATSTLDQSGTTAQADLYKNADGSYTRRVWSEPVNYQTSSGTWAPIDSTLVQGTGGRWQEKANSLAVNFAATGSDPALASLTAPGGSQRISFSLAGAGSAAATASGSAVTYPGILPDTSVTETATTDGLSESLTLSSAAAGNSWVFPLNLTGLTATLNGGSVDLTDSAGHVVGVIPPATARSGAVNLADPGSQQTSQLTYQLVTSNGTPALEMTLDPSWLNAPGRAFPVTVDPTVTLDDQGTSYVESYNGSPETGNNSGSEFLPSGTATWSGVTYNDIDFVDLASVNTSLAGYHVTSGSLMMFDAWADQCSTADSATAYQVTSAWTPSQSLTYPGPAYGTADAQWTGTASTAACYNDNALPGQGSWLSLAFNSAGVSLLNQWTANSGTNDGFAVVTSLSSSSDAMSFDSYNDSNVSSSQGGNCTGDCRPYLSLTYTTDIAPQVTSQYPANNDNAPTLTPELMASGSDADQYPLASPEYQFTLYNAAGTTKIDQSALLSSGDWTVPAGDLAWGQTYTWSVQAYDGDLYSPNPQLYSFTTTVPQPLVTSQLSQNPAGPGYNPQTGNWTSTATDADVATAGPALTVTRDYNSADPRVSGAFGAAWSSVLDMKVSPGEFGSSGTAVTQLVTYPDGEEVGFGLNANGTYSPPPGRFATFAAVSGGFKLTDKNDTVYLFTQALGSGVYGITSITDAFGRAETFGYNASSQITTITAASGRTLTVSWATPSGASYPHVTSVVTPDATAGNASTAQTWTYNYSGDRLASACPPASTTACTAYAYTSGSDYPDAVLDSGPHSYWRLDETSGSTAASSVLANEHTDDSGYTAVTLNQDTGPLTGSTAMAAAFNGSSSYVTPPGNLLTAAQYQTISLWFKTSSANGVLWSSSADSPGSTTTKSFNPELYIGSDGKLVGAFWDGTASDVMTSAAAVDNGQWHNAVLADTGAGQQLYLDGQQIGTLSKGFASHTQTGNFIGAGYLGGSWPDEPDYNPGSSTGYGFFFNGDIADAAMWTRQLSAAEVSALYSAATHQGALLTKLTRPSGSVFAQVSYDPLTSRVTTDTDSNGGTWTLNKPTVQGTSQAWVAAVQAAKPSDYYRLNDTGGADAANELYQCGCWTPAAYNNVTEDVSPGPFADQPAAQFSGSSSYLALPLDDAASGSPATVGIWFKTSGTNEVVYSEQTGPVTGSAPSQFDPVLYIGKDGKLNGELYDGSYVTAVSSAAVNDGKWHYAVLAAGSSSQTLYVDGQAQATVSGSVASASWTNVDAGAGFAGGSWPDLSSATVASLGFTGYLAELAWYPYQLSAAQVTSQWNTVQYATGLTPAQVNTVTDPGSNTLSWTYDLLNGGRLLSYTDADGGITSYAYNAGGFPATVTDPDGDITQTGYDPRGNKVSETTCQSVKANECSTSYWTYYPDDTSAQLTTPDPRNDMVLTYADGRSASSTDTTYQTSYTYDSSGDLTRVTTPPVSGYPSGRSTAYLYTSGTTAGGYSGAVPPKGLPYQETTPGGAVTTTLYYADGDVAQVTDPDGQSTLYTYDGLGRKISQTVTSNAYPSGLVTSYAYNANGNLATETDPAVTDAVTGAVHTAQTTTTYDPDNDVLTEATADLTGGDAARTVTSTYNSDDQLATHTDAAGDKTVYNSYDGYGNLSQETDPDGNVTQFTHDGNGNLLTTTLENYTGSPPGSQSAAPLVQESRSYDPAGRLAIVTDAMGRHTNYYYTDNGLLAGVEHFSADWSQGFYTEWNSYDGAGNLTEQWTNNNWYTDTRYTVDAAGRVTQQVTDPSGLDRTVTTSYTPDDQRASVTDSGPDGVSQTTSYTYDPAGNELSQSVTDPGAGGPAAWFGLMQSSGTAVPDQIAGGQSATASGVAWTGNEANFSGSAGSQVATAGPLADTTGSFTVAAWALLTATAGGVRAVVSQAAGTANGFTLQYDPATGNWEFARPLTDTASPQVAVAGSGANATAATGAWTFLAGTYDANTGTMTLYVNGVAAGTATDVTPVAAHGAFTVGSAKVNGAQGEWFDGQADTVQVYPRVLSPAEVSTLYGSNGDITTGTLTTTWTRDQRGLPTSMTDADGAVTGYVYDQAGQLTQTNLPMVTTQVYGGSPVTAHPQALTGYDTFGEVAETENANGNVTTDHYDGDGRPTSKTLPSYTQPGTSTVISSVTTTVYDGDGQVTSTTDGNNDTTRFGYDQLGNQVTDTAPDNSVTTTAYDTDGEVLSVTGPTGAQTDTTWDYMGRKATATQVERYTGSGTANYTTGYTYNDNAGGWLSQETSPDGVNTSYTYNPAGEQVTVTDGAGNTTAYAYDSLGRQTKVTYPDGTATTTGYDGVGNVISTAKLDASGNTLSSTAAAYDGVGDPVSETDAAGNSSTFTYDRTGLLTQETQPVSATSGIVTSFAYDAEGNQTLYTDGNGGQWWDTYNSWGLQESRVEPFTSSYSTAANSTFTTAYDANQNPVTETDPGGVTVTDTYNTLDELTGQSGAGADAATPARSFGYDTAGNMTSASTSNTLGTGSNATSEAFTYNDRGQVLTASGTAGSSTLGYNGDGLLTSVADAAGTTSYTYDNAGRLSTLANPVTGATATYSYNSDSLVTGVSYGSGKDSQSFGYDSQHRLTGDTLKTSSGTTVASVSYGYNADSEITSENTTGLAGAASNSYTYDEADRLTSWNNGSTTTQYGYDSNGNLTQKGSKTYTYDARDELTGDGTNTYAYTARGTSTSEPGPGTALTVSSDAYGDQMTAGTRAYAYDALGRLTGDTASSGANYAFAYVGSAGTLASDGSSVYTWSPSGGTLAGVGTVGGGTSGVQTLTDAHTNLVGQFTAAGTTIAGSTAYDPWGSVTATTGTPQGLLGYQSAWTDTAAGKDLMGARWYDPAAGDFTSRDTVTVSPDPDSVAGNPFAYAGDEPLDLVDPTGHAFTTPGRAAVNDAHVVTVSKPAPAPARVPNAPTVATTARTVATLKANAAKAEAKKPAPAQTTAAVKSSAKKTTTVASAMVASTVYRGLEAHAARSLVSSQQYAGANTYVIQPARSSPPAPASTRVVTHASASSFLDDAFHIGVVKGLLSVVDGAVNFIPNQISQIGNKPLPLLWHSNLAGSVSSWMDNRVGITSGSFAETVQNYTSTATQAGSLLIPGVDDAEAASLAARVDDAETGGSLITKAAESSCESFTPGTRVLLASGPAAPISSLKPGDKVLASDTRTGKDQPEAVTAVELNHDTDLYDLTVKTAHSTEVIHTTSNHLFWAPAVRKWIKAAALRKGEQLRTPGGSATAYADGGTVPVVHDGWMWDLTVPGNNDHDFYVMPADGDISPYYHVGRDSVIPLLVHNCVVNPKPGPAPEGSTLEQYGQANVGATNATTPDFVTEFTSASGARYYGRTELPGEGPIEIQPGSLVDDALRTDKISCSEVCAAVQAQNAEGAMGAYGGTFRTLQLRSLASQAEGYVSGVPVDPCPDSCQPMISTLGGVWIK